jgi:hypothetical protein
MSAVESGFNVTCLRFAIAGNIALGGYWPLAAIRRVSHTMEARAFIRWRQA